MSRTMKGGFLLLAMVMAGAAPAAAQSNAYVGVTGAAVVMDSQPGSLDTIPTYAAAGVFLGLRFHDAWSAEFHLDRGFGRSDEFSRFRGSGRATLQDRTGNGFAAFITWHAVRDRRVGVAATVGIASRVFEQHTLSMTSSDPLDHAAVGTKSVERGAGWSAGVFFPIRIGGRWSVAPEVRAAFGLTGERGSYTQLSTGVRLTWGWGGRP